VNKIPTLFVRDETDRRYVTDEVTPGCAWVLEGHGEATRKLDGTCMMFDGTAWWARREVKAEKLPPPGWVQVGEIDPVTGKSVGWEPAEQSAFAKTLADALREAETTRIAGFSAGTYELCGPKVNGNPENFPVPTLIAHVDAAFLDCPTDPDGIRKFVAEIHRYKGYEGIVWHWEREDGTVLMAKLKARDLRP
jgi:hypothetical protein